MPRKKPIRTVDLSVGIDLGGTNLRACIMTRSGKVVARTEERLTADKSPESIVAMMLRMFRFLKSEGQGKGKLRGVGVGAPGGVDATRGMVTQSPHLPDWRDVPLRQMLRRRIGLPVFVDNDANCFALGEMRFGNGQDDQHFLAVTLGTGMGGALIVDRRLWHGDSGMAGEFGHMRIALDGPPCACGSCGCLETFASGSALARMAREDLARVPRRAKGEESELQKLSDLKGENICEAAERGDLLACKVFERFGFYLGTGIGNLVNMTGIPRVILGGKVIRAWPFFQRELEAAISKQCFRAVTAQVRLTPAKLGDDAGLLGAASLVPREVLSPR